jgi:TonB family protein
VQRFGTITGEDYPPQARKEGKSGRVSAAFIVDGNGRATRCQTASSSGHAELDAETCRLIERRFRFKPATDAMGSSVDAPFVQNVNWNLPNVVDPKKDDILAKANDRCVFLGYKAKSQKFTNCVEEQLRLLSR